MMFDRMVPPVLTYGSEIWGYENSKYLENLHLQFCKYIVGVRRTTPNVMIYGELGRFQLDITVKCKVIGYWL